MKRLHWLVLGLALPALASCGDDDNPDPDMGSDMTTGMDMAVSAECPSGMAIPDEDGLMGACCYRESNESRQDAPEFRISSLRIMEPPALSASLVRSALNAALDEERFNWLIRVGIAGTDATIETGFGSRESGPTYSFASGSAPGPGDVNRWDPVTVSGTLAGETVTAPALTDTFTVPILEDDGVAVVLELPLQAFELVNATFSASRSCIGIRSGSVYVTSDGSLKTYITVADAMTGRVELPPIDTTLCNFIAGMASNTEPCTDTPQADWPSPPNAVCTGGVCSDTCTDDCNAWRITGGFAAHGIEIN